MKISYDGTTYEVLYDASTWYTSLQYCWYNQFGWWNTTELILTGIVAPTTLHFEVHSRHDYLEYYIAGGFLATVRLQCDDGEDVTFITDEGNTHFDVVYSEYDFYVMNNFVAFGSGVWGNLVNQHFVKCMDPNAYWMWNGRQSDVVVFELDLFANTTTSESPTFGMCLPSVYSL